MGRELINSALDDVRFDQIAAQQRNDAMCQKQKSTPFQGYQASFRFDQNPGAWGTCHPARRNESCIAVQARKATTQRAIRDRAALLLALLWTDSLVTWPC